jgi:hypothetical protein
MDFKNKENMITALVKLRGSLDGSPSLWWYQGAQYAVVDMESSILWQVEGVQLSKFESIDNGGWRHTLRDIMFYQHAETGELLKSFDNPWTGKTVLPPIARFGPFSVNYTVEGQFVDLPPEMAKGLSAKWAYEPVVIQGGDIYVRESGTTKITIPSEDPDNPHYHHINDYLTMVGRLDEIENPEIKEAAARNTYASVNDWSPWLEMGGKPGMVLGRGNSTKIATRDDLPEHIIQLVDKHEPDFFKDPTFPLWDKTYHPGNLDDSET